MERKDLLKWGFIGAGVAAGIVLLDAWVLEKYFFEVKHYTIGDRRSRNKLKVVLLSDLHFGEALWPFQQKLIRKINRMNPDLLLIAGDIIDQNGTWQPAKKFFCALRKSIPKVAIPGNHDHKNGVSLSTLSQILETNNCRFLMNETVVLNIRGRRVAVTGLDDFIEGNGSLEKAVEDIGYEKHHLLLVHSPLQQEEVLKDLRRINAKRPKQDELNIQYIFAGHNHGGQVRLPGYIPVLPEKSGDYIEGWYNDRPPYLYVSRGFGTSAVPFRFMARSEMVVLNYG
ncbi:MAG: phosphohydrolase [Sphingobacteriales bacterium]|nr:MAG: phosphohydrolase [Sphingobacteriales bacterium]